jgi:hypothetical protein
VTNTWGQGSYDTDDITRSAIAYLRHWRLYGDDHSRQYAYQLLRGAAYFQTLTGPNRGNFMIWMQPDGRLMRYQVPHDGNDGSENYSLARAIWAFGEGYEAFKGVDPGFARFLQDRLDVAFDALERQSLSRYGQYHIVDGLRWPSWFIGRIGANATADAAQGLIAYVRSTDSAADKDTGLVHDRGRRILTQYGEALNQMALGDAYRWPFGAIMNNAGYRAHWAGWGNMMPGVLAEIGDLLNRKDWVDTAVSSVATFAPHLIVQGGPDNQWSPAPVGRIQFGFSQDNLVQSLYKVGVAAHSRGIRDLAGVAAAWYFGDNYVATQMYYPDTGVLYDGLTADGVVNRNSGAETAHAVMSMLLLDTNPDLAQRALAATHGSRLTWHIAEAESGLLSGNVNVTGPCPFIGGEGQCSGREVILGEGGHITLTVEVPREGRYLVMPVAGRQQLPEGAVGMVVTVNNKRLADLDLGGAGPQGVTSLPGYPDIVTIDEPVQVSGTSFTLDIAYSGQPAHQIRVDGVLVQPLVEMHVVGDATGTQALLRSFSHRFETRTVTTPTAGLEAQVYDQKGRLVRSVVSRSATIEAPVPPGGFTVVSTRDLATRGDAATQGLNP